VFSLPRSFRVGGGFGRRGPNVKQGRDVDAPPLHAEDGVFMAPNNQSAVGRALTIAELVVMSPQ
jgi:hypothetical protein